MSLFLTTSLAAMLNLTTGPWLVINDDVMGGRSSAQVSAMGEGLSFRGTLSLANNGGFSSTRRLLTEAPAGATGIRLEVRGDGRAYQFRLRQDQRFDGVAWRAPFRTNGDWQVVELRFEDFEPVFRGRPVPEAGKADPERVSQVGFMIADKREGPFRLEVRRMEFFADRG
jgi:monofunctional biosynthetic peptidoglycan transglycosylase